MSDWINFARDVEIMIADAMEKYTSIDDVADTIGWSIRDAHERIGNEADDGVAWWSELTSGMRQDVLAFATIGLAVLCERTLRDRSTREN